MTILTLHELSVVIYSSIDCFRHTVTPQPLTVTEADINVVHRHPTDVNGGLMCGAEVFQDLTLSTGS